MDLSSGYPFFLIKEGLPFSYPKLETSLTTEVVIMGGGISGALLAYYLRNAGIDCVVVDARSIGLGSTCASTALLQYEIDTPMCELQEKTGLPGAVRSYRLCANAIDTIGKICRKIGFADFQQKKSLYYAAYKKDVPFLEKEYALHQANGFDVQYLNSSEIAEKYGFAAPGAILSGYGGQINAYAFTHALHQHNSKNGVKIFDRTPVTSIDHRQTGVTLKTENGATLRAKKLVYAVGYEVVKYIDKKIVDLQSTYAMVSEQFNDASFFWKDEVLLWNTATPYLYMRTTPDHRILIGGRDEDFYNPGKRDLLIGRKSKQLLHDFQRTFPKIPFKTEFSWTGTFGATADGLPFIGPYKKLPNSLFALGFGGNGTTFSVVAAEIIRDQLLGKKNEDAALFSFDRAGV